MDKHWSYMLCGLVSFIVGAGIYVANKEFPAGQSVGGLMAAIGLIAILYGISKWESAADSEEKQVVENQ